MDSEICDFFKFAEKTGEEKYQKKVLPNVLGQLFDETIENPREFFKKKMEDPMAAMTFFLNWSFIRGRNDELSLFYARCAIEAIKDVSGSNGINLYRFLSNNKINIILEKFQEKVCDMSKKEKGKEYKTNEKDISLLKSTFEKFKDTKDANYNAVKFLKQKIKNEGINAAYDWLISIIEIGDKIAGCILRDIIWLYGLEKVMKSKKDKEALTPVDTWVRQIIEDLYDKEKLSKNEIKNKIIEGCNNCDTSLIAVNQGIWYIGSHSWNIIKELLKI